EVAGCNVGDAWSHGLDDARGLVTEQERELIVDAALAVVQVRMAYAARLHRDQHLAGAGVRDEHLLDGDRLALGACDDTAHLVGHGLLPRCRPTAGRRLKRSTVLSAYAAAPRSAGDRSRSRRPRPRRSPRLCRRSRCG